MPTINDIILKKSAVGGKKPTATDLKQGEIAVNLVDRLLWTKDHTNAVVELSPSAIPAHRATNAYATGDIVVFNNKLYRAHGLLLPASYT